MIVSNPTNKKITVQIFGVEYTVDAESSVSGVPEAAARYWQERLHTFLKVEKEKEDTEKTLKRDEELKKEIAKKEKELEQKKKRS
jgi:hypothetical protein